jgi:hypothetical protein
MGFAIGRDEAGRRFVASMPKNDQAILADLEAREGTGRTGWVKLESGLNVFAPDTFSTSLED